MNVSTDVDNSYVDNSYAHNIGLNTWKITG